MFACSSKRALISTSASTCLAGLGGVDERLDDRAVTAGAVERLLDGEHVRVGGRLLEERLHARRERLVRVVQQDVAAGDRGEDVGLLGRVARQQADARRRDVLRELQVGPVDALQLEQAAEVERRREAVDLLLGDVELLHEQAERHVVHVVADLEPDRRAEAAAQQLLLERLDEVLGLVLLDLDVLVARDAELVVLEDLHAGEQVVEVVGDEVLEGDEAQAAALVIRELHEARRGSAAP